MKMSRLSSVIALYAFSFALGCSRPDSDASTGQPRRQAESPLLRELVGKTLQQFDLAGEMVVTPSHEMFWLVIVESDDGLGFRRCTTITGQVEGCEPIRKFSTVEGSAQRARIEIDGLGAATIERLPDRSWVKVRWSGPPYGSAIFKAWFQDDDVARAAAEAMGSSRAAGGGTGSPAR